MKIKPVYIYGVIAVAAILFLIFFTDRGSNEPGLSGNMPQDDIHKEFKTEQAPGRGNVSEGFYKQLEQLRKDVEENPSDTAKLMKYADFLTAAHQFDAAIPVYEDILVQDQKRTDVYFALTYIYYNKKDYKKAEEINNRILSYDKVNLQAQYNLGAIAVAQGNNEKAREVWNMLAKNNPGTQEAKMAEESLTKLQ